MSYFQFCFSKNVLSSPVLLNRLMRIIVIFLVAAGLFWFVLADVYAVDPNQNSAGAVGTWPETNLAAKPLLAASNGNNPGVFYEYFEGSWNNLPNFDALQPVKTGIVDTFSIAPRNRNDNFAFRFQSCISVAQAGSYTFYTRSDDGSKAFVNGIGIVNNDGLHGSVEKSGTLTLAAGIYPIEVTYFEKTGGEVLQVSYQGPGVTKQTIPGTVLSTDCLSGHSPFSVILSGTIVDLAELVDIIVTAKNPDGTTNSAYT